MTTEQLIVFGILAATLALFVWNRLRYDLVALAALLAASLAGTVQPDQVFSGFGHPAVIMVAAVLVISRGLSNAGVVDMIARILTRVGHRQWVQVVTLTGLVTLFSGFMNNVGALALMMPVAIWMSRKSNRSPSFLLMPLAFGSILGGMLTMIGTPPNIIIAEYRARTGAAPFGMFDFLPVGAGVAIPGLIFIAFLGWRLIPQREKQGVSADLFEIDTYTTEVCIPKANKFVGRTLYSLITSVEKDAEIIVLAIVRAEVRIEMPPMYEILREKDILLVEADSDSIKTFLDITGVNLCEDLSRGKKSKEKEKEKEKKEQGDFVLAEIIVTAGSMLVGTTPSNLDLRERFGVNVLAVARQGHRLHERLSKIHFIPGDILLVQGEEKKLRLSSNTLGCLPLASRGLRIGKPRKVLLAIAIFCLALVLIALELFPAATALVCCAIIMVLTGLIKPEEVYNSIDIPVIVLLAAILPIGQALESTGGSHLIAGLLLNIGRSAPPVVTLAILIIAVMLLSNLINNAAAAILTAPIAINLAQGMGVSVDPFLMAVSVGASCTFLTPIGHQSNTLVMAPGGYQFGDYWRMGLPLSILVAAFAVPLILWIWPL